MPARRPFAVCRRPAPGRDGCPHGIPEAACHYLLHTEAGLPIRAVARRAGGLPCLHGGSGRCAGPKPRRDDPACRCRAARPGRAHFQPPSGPQAGDCTPMKPNASRRREHRGAPARRPSPNSNASEDLPDAATGGARGPPDPLLPLRRLCEPGRRACRGQRGWRKPPLAPGNRRAALPPVRRWWTVPPPRRWRFKDWIACGTPGPGGTLPHHPPRAAPRSSALLSPRPRKKKIKKRGTGLLGRESALRRTAQGLGRPRTSPDENGPPQPPALQYRRKSAARHPAPAPATKDGRPFSLRRACRRG